ncbi:hypothetical protein GCM10023257_69930 [Streptomyces hyderabadensis]|uniref:Uncharacterized protein n=1 Tax=Streptomyces hyderabadensis TaxID=598549 RepID=A0ABP9IWK3_9ACTN
MDLQIDQVPLEGVGEGSDQPLRRWRSPVPKTSGAGGGTGNVLHPYAPRDAYAWWCSQSSLHFQEMETVIAPSFGA